MDFASWGHWKRQERNYLWWRRRVLRLTSIAPHAHGNLYVFRDHFFLYLDYCIRGACSSNSFMEVWTDRENRRRLFFTCTFSGLYEPQELVVIEQWKCHGLNDFPPQVFRGS